MGNLESALDRVNVTQLQNPHSRFLDLSRSLTYEQYQEHSKEANLSGLEEVPQDLMNTISFYEKLDASFNCIGSIPVEFSFYLPHLSHLDLSHNRILSLPESFGYLCHLQTLLLNNNKLRELPDSFCLLIRLQKADLAHNMLVQLPSDIGKIESLEKLNVSNNKLEALPVSLGGSTTLTFVLAMFNNCKSPPQVVCNQGSGALLQFLRQQSPKEPPKRSLDCTLKNKFPRVRGGVVTAASTNPDTARTQYKQTQTSANSASRIKMPLLPPAGATDLPPEDLVDRVVGCLYGAAIADAVGLCTEFMTPDECCFYYDKASLCYKDAVRDRHRSKWERGDWTDSFDQMVLILENILHWAGVVDELAFAKSLVTWCKDGYPELGDNFGRGIRGVLAKVIGDPAFLTDPHGTAKAVWELHKSPSNGAVMRTGILGVAHFHNLDEVETNAVRICKATHYDPRCVASCVAVSVIIALILQGKHNLEEASGVEDLLSRAKARGKTRLREPADQKDFSHYFQCQSFEEVEFCEPRMADYTMKPLGAGVVALRSLKDFEPAISELVMEGGHATCNATVAGAILGCRFGFSKLPRAWVDGLLPKQVTWLNGKINSLLDMMALP